jgi:sulfatase maturation enzyme AslB (radical SAM superfamily)
MLCGPVVDVRVDPPDRPCGFLFPLAVRPPQYNTHVSTGTFRLRYLARTAAGVPRDLMQTFVASKIGPIRPTVLIYNCTWVCDARCEMCSNWKHGDRKSDMTLEQLEPAMRHPFWGHVENLNISGGEPTTRNDLPEMVEMFERHLPRMRKIGINTTGLTPHRAIPMLTRIVKFCAAHDLLISVRVSLDGIGDIHDQVRHVKRGFDKANETIAAMQALAGEHANFQFGIASTIFATNLDDAENILTWARTKKLDVVFNMLRFTDAMLNNKELQDTIGFREREEEFMRKFFLDRVQEESVLSGQAFLYLHYADMIANGYKRTMPCPFQTQGLLLNPYGDLYYCENSQPIGNVLTTPAEELYFRADNLAHREHVKDTICPTCLSPCQVNVGAMKQFVPYAKFLVRASQVKRNPAQHLKTLPSHQV